MGKKDTITKEYIRNPIVFADVFNKFIYDGEQIIQPENLTELDTTEITLPYGDGNAVVPEQKYRDVLKLVMADGHTTYCILGVENQSDVHYAMPVRNMVYDAMQLSYQVAKAAQSHRSENKEKDDKENNIKDGKYKPSSEEYLSGFYKTDKLIPVVTVVIFWGSDKWDGPLSLRDMYDIADEAIMQYVPDYKVHLIAPEQMTEEEIGKFKTSLKEVMLYIKYSNDKNKLQKMTQANQNFKDLDRQAAEVINVTTNSKLRYPERKERIDMCLAIEEMVADGELRGELRGRLEGRLEGKIEGTVKTYKEVGFSFQEAINRITDNYNLSLQEAEEKVTLYWE